MRHIVNFGGKYRQGSSQHRKSSISRLYVVLILGVAMTLMIVLPVIPKRAYASKPSIRQNDISLARLSNQTSIESAGRGNPWINMNNGHDLLTSFRAPDDSDRV